MSMRRPTQVHSHSTRSNQVKRTRGDDVTIRTSMGRPTQTQNDNEPKIARRPTLYFSDESEEKRTIQSLKIRRPERRP
jgi:hypothetical protein